MLKERDLKEQVEWVIDKVMSLEVPVLIVWEREVLRAVKSGTSNYERLFRSPKTVSEKIVGVYDWAADPREIRADLHDFLKEKGLLTW